MQRAFGQLLVVIGATLIVRDLSTERDTTFGNVSEYALQDKGSLLAFVISAEDKTGNAVQDARRAPEAGPMAATVAQFPDEMGRTAVGNAVKAQGKSGASRSRRAH